MLEIMRYLMDASEDWVRERNYRKRDSERVFISPVNLIKYSYLYNNSIEDGLNTAIDNMIKTLFSKPEMLQSKHSIHVLLMWSGVSSIIPGDGCQRITWSWQVMLLNGLYELLYASKKVIAVYLDLWWCIWMLFLLNFYKFWLFFFCFKNLGFLTTRGKNFGDG